MFFRSRKSISHELQHINTSIHQNSETSKKMRIFARLFIIGTIFTNKGFVRSIYYLFTLNLIFQDKSI